MFIQNYLFNSIWIWMFLTVVFIVIFCVHKFVQWKFAFKLIWNRLNQLNVLIAIEIIRIKFRESRAKNQYLMRYKSNTWMIIVLRCQSDFNRVYKTNTNVQISWTCNRPLKLKNMANWPVLVILCAIYIDLPGNPETSIESLLVFYIQFFLS